MMDRILSRLRRPVKRAGSETYLLITLLSFASSVAITRLFLELTGYPQLGGSELHIAHVLWGGLLLFVAALLPLILANRWVYLWGALLGGIGVGLFIDEVGKFITQSNDYFYPPAAPIIYAFFLLTVLLYNQIRRPHPRDARIDLYHAFDALQEVLDHDLDQREKAELEAHLTNIVETASHPNLIRLASELLDFVASDAVEITIRTPTVWDRLRSQLEYYEHVWVKPVRTKAILAGGLASMGIWSIVKLGDLVITALNPVRLELFVAEVVMTGQVASSVGLSWLTARLALEGAVGLIFVIASAFLVTGREQRGLELGYLGLLLSLTTVNLLVFFYEQFSTILLAAIQFGLLLILLYYRRRFLNPEG